MAYQSRKNYFNKFLKEFVLKEYKTFFNINVLKE